MRYVIKRRLWTWSPTHSRACEILPIGYTRSKVRETKALLIAREKHPDIFVITGCRSLQLQALDQGFIQVLNNNGWRYVFSVIKLIIFYSKMFFGPVHYMYAAEKNQVKHLKAFCEEFMTSKMNNDNAIAHYNFAQRHNAYMQLLEAALSLIMDNMAELVQKDPWLVVEIYGAYLTRQVNTAAIKVKSAREKTLCIHVPSFSWILKNLGIFMLIILCAFMCFLPLV